MAGKSSRACPILKTSATRPGFSSSCAVWFATRKGASPATTTHNVLILGLVSDDPILLQMLARAVTGWHDGPRGQLVRPVGLGRRISTNDGGSPLENADPAP